MRLSIFALVVILASPALAVTAYSSTLQKSFLHGCYPKDQRMLPENQDKLKKMCDCALNEIEGAMTEDQFMAMQSLPDKGRSKVKPLLISCMAK